ncbi:hypothetical protein [Bradyrhizobium sp. LHD-71]|nr:hypothetical protein [Bradyrhizobium sp. LHD-71]MDQ8732688.1 hypothetical protein [Bradyrhizobium sp. LHD-71]
MTLKAWLNEHHLARSNIEAVLRPWLNSQNLLSCAKDKNREETSTWR